MLRRFSPIAVARFIATEWGCYSLVVLLSVLAKTIIPVMLGLLPGPVDLYWIARTPLYALNMGLALALLLLPLDIALRWAMTPFSLYLKQMVPIALCVTGFEIWDKTSRIWDGGSERIMISICAVAIAGVAVGSFRAWIRRPRHSQADLDVIFS